MKGYVIELEDNVWCAAWAGDPGRTTVKENASVYATEWAASRRLTRDRRYRNFKNAKIVKL